MRLRYYNTKTVIFTNYSCNIYKFVVIFILLLFTVLKIEEKKCNSLNFYYIFFRLMRLWIFLLGLYDNRIHKITEIVLLPGLPRQFSKFFKFFYPRMAKKIFFEAKFTKFSFCYFLAFWTSLYQKSDFNFMSIFLRVTFIITSRKVETIKHFQLNIKNISLDF